MIVNKQLNDLKHLKSIVFDFDGTIVDSREGIEFCLRKTLSSYQIHYPKDAKIKNLIGYKLGEIFENVIPLSKKNIIPELVKDFRSHYETEGIKTSKIYDGIPETLRQLKKKNIRLFIVTNKPLDFTISLCRKFDIGDFFDGIMGTQITEVYESKENFIKDLKKKKAIDTKYSCYVGDLASDIDLAKKHNMYSVGVLYGYGKKKDLIKTKPNFLISSFAQLINYL